MMAAVQSVPVTPIRVKLIHPRPIERRALGLLVESFRDFELVDEADSCHSCATTPQRGADVVLCAIPQSTVCRLPGTSARDDSGKLAELRRSICQTPAIAMLDNKSPTQISATLHFGFSGVLTVDASGETLYEALRTVAAGECFLDPTAQAVLVDPHYRNDLVSSDLISQTFNEREIQVLNLLADGKSNDQIAAEISLSSSAVKQSLRTLFNKLGVNNRSAAVAIAVGVWAFQDL